MDDLISKAAALDAIDSWHIGFRSMDGAKVQTDCWKAIKELPAIDAIPVKWLFDWRDRALKEGMNPELVEWIEYILQIWSREKEDT